MNKFPSKIAIIGVGLIGGSIALGLKQHLGAKIKIFGSCSNLTRSTKAKNEGLTDEIFDINNVDPNIQLFIITTLILEIPKILKKLAAKIPTNGWSTSGQKNQTLIMDVASTKEFITKSAVKILPKHITFIGTHPMAGNDMSGFENADPNLFRHKPWVVCGDATKVVEIISLLGAKIILMDSKKHDELVTWASHLNLVSASLLTNTITKQNNWHDVAQIASTGLRDTTRLASSDVGMKKDIILTNKENIMKALTILKSEIDLFIKFLKKDDVVEITNYLSKAKNSRDNWLTQYFS